MSGKYCGETKVNKLIAAGTLIKPIVTCANPFWLALVGPGIIISCVCWAGNLRLAGQRTFL